MGEQAYRRIPIVAPGGQLIGLLSLDDVVVALGAEADWLLGVLRASKT